MYRFRFHSGFEQELRYISHVFDLESAAYNFSLNSTKHVKKFFINSLFNIGEKDTGVLSRTHIILGDMSAIEQSYNAASDHYSIAIRILRNLFHEERHEERTALNQVNLINYIEALLKQGDLAEHRQNYGHAAALYSEAETIIEQCINLSNLSTTLQNGDSKWDLLKQPFWANKYLSLKRSLPPFKGDLDEHKVFTRPDYLYRDDDPRFCNFSACLYFFMGEPTSAVDYYARTIKLIDQKQSGLQFNERNSYLYNFAKVGIVESAFVYYSRKFSNYYVKNEDLEKTDKILNILNELMKLIDKENNLPSQAFPSLKINDLNSLLKGVVENYEDNRLYISSVLTCIKTICFFTTILDSFDNKNQIQPTKELIQTVSDFISEMAIRAIRCIDKARQLESSQNIKTFMVYDVHINNESETFTKLIDYLLKFNLEERDQFREDVLWQQTLWMHKLASALLWFSYVKNKFAKPAPSFNNWPHNVNLHDVSFISIRSAITIRWIYARHQLDVLIDKIYKEHEGKEDVIKILKEIIEDNPDFKFTKLNNKILQSAYEISRHLYFSLHSSRIISRKNIDLIFPRLSQIYYIQWRLLINLIVVILHTYRRDGTKSFSSVRDVAFLLQKKFIELDEKLAPNERIPPSYFDYEYIYLRLEESLESSISLMDRTSRSNMGIFQHKYFCHDDFSDQEFHMDYTLAYVFVPMSLYFKDKIKDVQDNLKRAIQKIWCRD